MILAVNVGNTHITFGVIENNKIIQPVMSIKTDRNQTAFGYAAEMKSVLDMAGFRECGFEGAVLSSVVPPLTRILDKAIEIVTEKKAIIVGAGIKSGIHLSTDDPGSVAADLVAMAVAAKTEYELPCVIVDMGTAVTLTVVDEDGKFIGGAFMPGINLSLNALFEEASLLPRIEVMSPKKAIGSSTVECVRSGVIYGYAGAVDGIIDKFTEELGKTPATIVTTGGMAEVLGGYLKRKTVYDENLLLKGLGYIYEKNLLSLRKKVSKEPFNNGFVQT